MEIDEDAVMLRIYLGESDRHAGRPAYKAIVGELRNMGIWGATVVRGVYGYGKRSVLHAASPLRLSQDLPVVVEAVDAAKKIDQAIARVREMVGGGLVVTIPVRVHVHVG